MIEKIKHFMKKKVKKEDMLLLCLAMFGVVTIVTLLFDFAVKLIFPVVV